MSDQTTVTSVPSGPSKVGKLLPWIVAGAFGLLSIGLLPYAISSLRQTPARESVIRSALAPEDRVAVIGFNERTDLLSKFTDERKKIAWAIERAEGKGGTKLYSALDYALKQLAGEGKRRKAIVVLTDGLDTNMRNLDRAVHVSVILRQPGNLSPESRVNSALVI